MTAVVPFQPIGEVSRRELVLRVLASAEYDELVEYDRLAEVLGGVGRKIVQSAVGEAKPGTFTLTRPVV